jgi:hypothetical protein
VKKKNKKKAEVLTFKADASLLEAMKGIPNRSEFIRNAILAALDGACPLCNATGTLTPNQKKHWDAFARDHSVEKCAECNELILVCGKRADHGRPKTASSTTRGRKP